jgi:hypothetical protein
VQVQERRFEALDEPFRDVQEAGAPRPAQKLAAGGGEHVAPDRGHVDRQLADRLAGVQQVRHAGRPSQRADLRGRVDQPAVRGHVGDRDQRGTPLQLAGEVVERREAVRVALDHLDHRAGAAGDLEQRDDVARVLGADGQHAVAGAQVVRVERHVPAAGGVFHDGDLARRAADQPGDRRVRVVHAGRRRLGRLVSADPLLQAEVADHRVGDGGGREGGARVVEVHHVFAAGRLPAGPGNVDHVACASVTPNRPGGSVHHRAGSKPASTSSAAMPSRRNLAEISV